MEKGRKAFFIGKIPISRWGGGLSGREVESEMFCLFKKIFFPKVPPGVSFQENTHSMLRGRQNLHTPYAKHRPRTPTNNNKHIHQSADGPSALCLRSITHTERIVKQKQIQK